MLRGSSLFSQHAVPHFSSHLHTSGLCYFHMVSCPTSISSWGLIKIRFPAQPQVLESDKILVTGGRSTVLTVSDILVTVSTHQNYPIVKFFALGLVLNTYSYIFNFLASCRKLSVSKPTSSRDWTQYVKACKLRPHWWEPQQGTWPRMLGSEIGSVSLYWVGPLKKILPLSVS